jgi:DNA-binding MarR family transcriptional regulator
MDKKLIKAFYDACHSAKRIVEMIPSSPDGLLPHSLHILSAIHSLNQVQENVRITDVAMRLNLSKGTTAEYIHELSEKRLVAKKAGENHRYIYVKLTDQGEEYYDKYVERYHEKLAHIFGGVNNNDMLITIRTIQQAYYLMNQERERSRSCC